VIEGLVIAVPTLPIACGLLVQLARTPTAADRIHVVGSLAIAATAITLAIVALAQSATPTHNAWYLVDGASGVFLAVVAVIGLLSALVSPAYLATAGRSFFRATRARAWYYLGFHLFWAALLAIPLVNNLGVAWLLIEATTGASALLVAYSGRRTALEAGWKYLVLTTFGLTIALVGILILYVGLVIALGIGFGTPLAIAGVVLHLAGHALAKALGFYAAIPLLRHQPEAAHGAPRGIARVSPGTATAMGVSLGTLGGLPPSPLFFSELLILLGGIAAGQLVVTLIAATLLALGFLGLGHALIEGLLGGEHHRAWRRGRSVRLTERLAWVIGLGLLALSAGVYLLPGSTAVHMLMRGLT
jgi:formate hydrogenlyase subunit 3/multisubunit Na+/H+ antiporter MnhD subunit